MAAALNLSIDDFSGAPDILGAPNYEVCRQYLSFLCFSVIILILYLSFQKSVESFRQFFETFRPPVDKDGIQQPLKYAPQILDIKNKQRIAINVGLDDLVLHNLAELAAAIEQNTKRYVELCSMAIDQMLDSLDDPDTIDLKTCSVQEIILQHRIHQIKEHFVQNLGQALTPVSLRELFPVSLLRNYEVRFIPRSETKPAAIREVRANNLGQLVKIRAMVLRVSDVKPSIQVASYIWYVMSCFYLLFHSPCLLTFLHPFACSDTCGYELFQEVFGRTFMPLSKCTSDPCRENNTSGRLHLQTRNCRFTKHQEVRVQELPDQVPTGHIPRSLTILARGETTRVVGPGDVVEIAGVFLPTPYTGFQAIRAGLTADTYLEAHLFVPTKKADTSTMDVSVVYKIEQLSMESGEGQGPYEKLSRSIAPEIYGLNDVKKALLLQLVGGANQEQEDGMRIRGDINICLMGDPGVAKSQLLKHMSKIAPRCVYTTGKGSSGVGLTAAVVKDPITNEMSLEGGALVLADRGICCIDEFDKMEESDRTAIHEVMEQQTVSIAKAGITTTLNARTAVLAAANPRYGRYIRMGDDPHKSLLRNVNLPTALLSRFDLLFLLLDEVDENNDTSLARHITHVHQRGEAPALNFEAFEPEFIRQYITIAKLINPTIPRNLSDYISNAYSEMRQRDKEASDRSKGNVSITTTPRQLLSLLRLATARARVDLRAFVNKSDIDEAVRLIATSKASVMETGEAGQYKDSNTRVWHIVKTLLRDGGGSVLVEHALRAVLHSSMNEDDFNRWYHEYSSLGIVAYNLSGTMLEAL